MIALLTRWTERHCPEPLRELTRGPWAWWKRALQRSPSFYRTLHALRRHAAPGVRLLQVHIEPTNACNLACRGCVNGRQKAPRGMMPFETARRAIDEARETVGPDAILGFYIRGESTLHPRLAEMVGYAREKGMRRLLLSTNLTKLDRHGARELLAAGLSELRLSIDGADKDAFEGARRGADFGRVCEAVDALFEERRRLSSDCRFRLHAALDDAGFLSVPAFVRRWGSAVDCFKFTAAVNQGGLLSTRHAREISRLDFAQAERFQIPCRVLFNSAGITWDGKITSCCVDYDEHFVVGRLEEGIEKVFLNAGSEKLRADHVAGKLGPVCGKCGFANALVDWFEDEVNEFVDCYRKQLLDPSFDDSYRRWLRRSISKFNLLARQEVPGGK